jgi:DNA mismatch endonuclease (patch repair protein)
MRKITREADIVFTSAKVAIFVDGCFWHECPIHGSIPVSNHEWWKTKLDRNKDRDIETNEFLRAAGWVVVRIWEHDDYCLAADMINKIVTQRRLSFSTTPNK